MFVLLFFVGWWIFLIFYEKLSLVLEFMTGGQSGRYFKLFCSDWELCISTRSQIWSQYCWWERSNNVKDCWNNTRDLLLDLYNYCQRLLCVLGWSFDLESCHSKREEINVVENVNCSIGIYQVASYCNSLHFVMNLWWYLY